jgi:ketosteroid isomerase-like protein
MRRLSALAVCAIAACGGASSPPPAAPVEPAVDGRKAERDAKGLVTEIYATLGRGKTDSLFSLVSDPVIVFGPRRTDAMTTRSDALVALGPVVDTRGKRRLQLRSAGLEVVVSPGGHSAWASDVLHLDGQQLAVTAVLANTDDIWAVTAAAVAETPSEKQVRAESSRDAIVPPGVPPGAGSAGKVHPGASAAIEKFKKGLLDQQTWGDELASRSDAVVVGPTAGDVARGKQAIKRMWKARMKANVRAATSGELSAAMTGDGQLVWISVPITRVADDEEPMPLRVFAVYENDGGAWNLIALHEALAVDAPGSGTPFKKIVPPALEPPEPPPEPAKAEPLAKKAAKGGASPNKAKKKKKRARPSDD